MPPCLLSSSERCICSPSESKGVSLPTSPPGQAMNDQILSFLDRLDEVLLPFAKEGEYFDMFNLGRSALVMHYGFRLATNDIDIVWLRHSDLEQKAIELLGKDSPLALTLGLYLDPVPQPDTPGLGQGRCPFQARRSLPERSNRIDLNLTQGNSPKIAS